MEDWAIHPSKHSPRLLQNIWSPIHVSLIFCIFLLLLNPIGSLIHCLPTKTVFFQYIYYTLRPEYILIIPFSSWGNSASTIQPQTSQEVQELLRVLAHPDTFFKLIYCLPKRPALQVWRCQVSFSRCRKVSYSAPQNLSIASSAVTQVYEDVDWEMKFCPNEKFRQQPEIILAKTPANL